MKVFIICPVNRCTKSELTEMQRYVKQLELCDHAVHLPHRDTNQSGTELQICNQNKTAITNADEVHIFYKSNSKGIFFDMGMCFVLNKKTVLIKNFDKITKPGKSFLKLIASK